jgi:multiple sugar transport system substrate-binding protein
MKAGDFRGITWSHPRGYAPLMELARLCRPDGPLAAVGSTIHWDRQDLAGFEAHSVADLAMQYDLIVLDHPGLGDALRHGSLRSLDSVFTADELAGWAAATVGASFGSYAYQGHQWALPIDAATQVCAVRPDLLEGGGSVPDTWAAALALARHATVAVPTKDPHTLLTFLGIAAAVAPHFQPDEESLVPVEAAEIALDVLTEAVTTTPEHLLNLDPIQLLDRMQHDDIACIPLVFGYVNYSAQRQGSKAVVFKDAPSIGSDTPPGTVLGGTGLAISARRSFDRRVLAHIRACMDQYAQTIVIPGAGGQPSAVAAWESPLVNRQWLNFYADTRRSIDCAWRRPRFPGWIQIQSAGSRLLLDGIQERRSSTRLLTELAALYRKHRPSGYPN